MGDCYFYFLVIDKSFIKKLANNDQRAQLLLYKKCFSILMSVAYRYKNNEEDAKSLAISSFLKILKNIEKYKDEIPFEAWIRRISINNAIDDFRKNQRRKDIIEYNDKKDLGLIIMQPYETQNLNNMKQVRESLNFWRNIYSNISNRTLIKYKNQVDDKTIFSAFQNYPRHLYLKAI